MSDKRNWCVTEWYDGPLRSIAKVLHHSSGRDAALIEVRTNLGSVSADGDYCIRFDREELQRMLDLMDGKPVEGFFDEAPQSYEPITEAE